MPQDSTIHLDLTQNVQQRGTLRESQPPAYPDVTSLSQPITRDTLLKNYAGILNAGNIYYPVAYQLPRLLGRGQQGHVFLGLRQGARGCITENAIKIYNPVLYNSPEEYWTDMGRIAAQISRMQRSQSPNLVARYSYEETFGIGYVQMESIDGLDLVHVMQARNLQVAMTRSTANEWNKFSQSVFRLDRKTARLQPGFVVYLMRGILRGLEQLHNLGFLHFDLKPGNVMLDRLGTVKIIDFGRAVRVNEKVSFLFGSPQYMAPETHRLQAGSPQTDLYSLGLIALELLRGEPLTTPDADENTLLQMKLSIPKTLENLLPPYVAENKELVSILKKMLAADPSERYQSARDAEVGPDGLIVIDRQLIQAGLDTEYARDFSDYLSKLVDPQTGRIESSALQ
ncbi:MAG: serine/threonine-protein kinase [Kiritimatiellia bacterium]